MPLRGDEAFAIRYWAADPAETLQPGGLASREPHPYGTFLAFWAWRSLMGDSEVAMRALPALINLIGAAACYGIARRLTGRAAAGLVAALLWALNPNLIWHSGDARNYALWAGLSALSLYALIRAAERPAPAQWALYGLTLILSLYVFFLEAFMIVVGGLYVLITARRALRGWLMTLIVCAPFLIPLGVQAAALAGSGYTGTLAPADLGAIPGFFGVLLFGELSGVRAAGLIIIVVALVAVWRHGDQRAALLAGLSIVPIGALYAFGTRLNVFDPRYVIALTPSLCAVLAAALTPLALRERGNGVRVRLAALIGIVALCAGSLAAYWNPSYTKSPDWFALRAALAGTSTADTVIIPPADASGAIDPAYGYYYRGPGRLLVLPYPAADPDQFVAEALARGAVYALQPDPTVRAALEAHGHLTQQRSAGRFGVVTVYTAGEN